MQQTTLRVYTAILAVMILSSCEPDPCRDTFCYQGGECVDGVCFCRPGQYNADCSGSLASDLSGSFQVTSFCGLAESFYSSTISSVVDTPWLIRLSHPNNSIDEQVQMEAIFDTDGNLSIVDSTILIDGTAVSISGSADIISNDSLILSVTYNGLQCQEIYYK